MSTTIETREFLAEARQLLDLMIHSVYSEKDIFLRELISNASDALDKLRLESLVNTDLEVKDPHIFLEPDKDARTLTIRDNGIGMSREDVVNLIGTIAKSGTREYLQQLKDKPDLIGQFGVGFYSCFMVAERVTLVTRKAGQTEATRWESSGDGTYTIEPAEREEHGTTITLHLRAADPENGLHDYTEPWKLKEIVKRYSDFISYPVRMLGERQEAGEEGGDPRLVKEVQTLNSMKALWMRPKDEVTADEYKEFYKHVAHDWNDPFETISMKGEGTSEYHALVFLPSRAPFDMFMPESKRGLQLYVRRVFIMDHCEELLPGWLRFVRGVVDAQDLPLNISREILQKERHIEQIRKRLVKKVLDTLQEIKDADAARFQTFWKEFGRVLKEGLYHEHGKIKDAILELGLFKSTHDDGLTDLKSYVERMKEGQDAIYYLAGESQAAVEKSPHLETFRARGVEVLILTDPVDEVWLGPGGEYQGKQFISAAKGELKLGTDEERKAQDEALAEQRKEYASFLLWLASKLDIKEARLSTRLTDSPACLVGDTYDMSAHLERLMKSMGQEVPKTKRILEVNADHALVQKLKAAHDEKKDAPELVKLAEVLYGVAVLAEGGELEQPADFSKAITELMLKAI